MKPIEVVFALKKKEYSYYAALGASHANLICFLVTYVVAFCAREYLGVKDAYEQTFRLVTVGFIFT